MTQPIRATPNYLSIFPPLLSRLFRATEIDIDGFFSPKLGIFVASASKQELLISRTFLMYRSKDTYPYVSVDY